MMLNRSCLCEVIFGHLSTFYVDVLDTGHGGNNGRGRKPTFPQHSGVPGTQTRETASHILLGLQFVSGCGKPQNPTLLRVDKGQP